MHPRLKAALVYLAITALVLTLVLTTTLLAWYPPPWWALLDLDRPLLVKLAMVLAGAPLLVAVVWKAGKRGLKFDLVVIALLQLVALGFFLHGLHQGRPLYAVFNVDRFNVLWDADLETLVGQAPPPVPWRGPLLVAAHIPTDPADYDRLLTETLFEGQPDIERRPAHWGAFADARAQVLAAGKPLSVLAGARPERAGAVAAAARRLGREPADLRFLPVVSGGTDTAVVLDPETAEPCVFIDVDPWIGP